MPELWTEATVDVASDCADAVASFLIDLGSPGLITEEREQVVTLTAYLDADPDAQLRALRAFCDNLIAASPGTPVVKIATRPLPQADWAHNWRAHFPPLTVGQRLYIIPPWIHEVPRGRIAIIIDPGLAFGTGHHATTQSCLTLVESIVAARPTARALDVGTGSGILAIALAKLGVAEVHAIDIDPEARRAAMENCARNGVAERVRIGEEVPSASPPFDLIVANLLSSLLIELTPMLTAALARGGHLIASGILVGETDAVVQAFAKRHLVEHTRLVCGEWVTLDFTAAS